jgi:hypothetical protein
MRHLGGLSVNANSRKRPQSHVWATVNAKRAICSELLTVMRSGIGIGIAIGIEDRRKGYGSIPIAIPIPAPTPKTLSCERIAGTAQPVRVARP